MGFWNWFKTHPGLAAFGVVIGVASLMIASMALLRDVTGYEFGKPDAAQPTFAAPSDMPIVVEPTHSPNLNKSPSPKVSKPATIKPTNVGPTDVEPTDIEPTLAEEDESDARVMADPNVYLDAAVDAESCHRPGNTGYPLKAMMPIIGRTEHVDGFGCLISLEGQISGYADFLVPDGVQNLVGVAGIDDRSPNTSGKIRFSIVAISGTSLFDTTAVYGKPYKINVDVRGQSRLRLKIQLAGFRESPYDSEFTACWADMRFT